MLRQSRRRVAGVLGVLMLHTTIAPTVVGAAGVEARARQKSLASLQVVELFASDGRLEQRFDGAGLVERVTAQTATLRKISADTIAVLRATFQRFGKISKRGEAGVAKTLMILDALAAPTEAEYHLQLRRLPVTVERHLSRDQSGREGVLSEYRLNGQLKARTFVVTTSRSGTGVLEVAEAPTPQQSEYGVTADSPDEGITVPAVAAPAVAAAHPTPSSFDTCEYTDEDNVYWSGECATQQEINEAWAVAISLQDDVDGIDTQTQSESRQYCNLNPWDCWQDAEDDAARAGVLVQTSALFESQDALGFAEEMSPSSSDTRISHGPRLVEEPDHNELLSCYASGIAYAGSLAAFGLRIARLSAVLGAVAPPAGAVGEAVGWGIIAAGAVAGSAIALHECMME